MKNNSYKWFFISPMIAACMPMAASAEPPGDFQMEKAVIIQTAIGGCMAAVTNSFITGHMNAAQARGRYFATIEEAKADLTGSKVWKKGIEPGIYSCCKELIEPILASVEAADSREKIISEIQRFTNQGYANILNEEESQQKMRSCMDDTMRRTKAYMDSLK